MTISLIANVHGFGRSFTRFPSAYFGRGEGGLTFGRPRVSLSNIACGKAM